MLTILDVRHFIFISSYLWLPLIALLCGCIQLRAKGPLLGKDTLQRVCSYVLPWYLLWVVGIHGLLIAVSHFIPQVGYRSAVSTTPTVLMLSAAMSSPTLGLAIASAIAFIRRQRSFYLCVLIIFVATAVAHFCVQIINHFYYSYHNLSISYISLITAPMILAFIASSLYWLAYKGSTPIADQNADMKYSCSATLHS